MQYRQPLLDAVGLLAVCDMLRMVDSMLMLQAQQRKRHVQVARNSPACKAFNGLKDEKAVSQAVRKGTTPLLKSDKGDSMKCAHKNKRLLPIDGYR